MPLSPDRDGDSSESDTETAHEQVPPNASLIISTSVWLDLIGRVPCACKVVRTDEPIQTKHVGLVAFAWWSCKNCSRKNTFSTQPSDRRIGPTGAAHPINAAFCGLSLLTGAPWTKLRDAFAFVGVDRQVCDSTIHTMVNSFLPSIAGMSCIVIGGWHALGIVIIIDDGIPTCNKSLHVQWITYLRFFIESTRASIMTMRQAAIQDALQEGTGVMKVLFDTSWSHPRLANEASGELLYYKPLHPDMPRPIIAQAVSLKERCGS